MKTNLKITIKHWFFLPFFKDTKAWLTALSLQCLISDLLSGLWACCLFLRKNNSISHLGCRYLEIALSSWPTFHSAFEIKMSVFLIIWKAKLEVLPCLYVERHRIGVEGEELWKDDLIQRPWALTELLLLLKVRMRIRQSENFVNAFFEMPIQLWRSCDARNYTWDGRDASWGTDTLFLNPPAPPYVCKYTDTYIHIKKQSKSTFFF